ncbi:MAG: hypothetical protein ACRDTT_07410 [Pseudonocardiaceae bacterium]
MGWIGSRTNDWRVRAAGLDVTGLGAALPDPVREVLATTGCARSG